MVRGCGRNRQSADGKQGDDEPQDTLRQSEEYPAALAKRTRGGHGTNGEYLTDFTVFLNDALAVEQAEAVGCLQFMIALVVDDRLGIEEMVELFAGHALSCILNGNLHAVVEF